MSAEKFVVITPGDDTRLVWPETTRALREIGCVVEARDEAAFTAAGLNRLFALPPERSNLPAHPSLFFSINFHGLDKFGEAFSVLHGKGIPVAVWCVDNPWNLLSGLRTDFWKNVHLFVTDPSFIPGLKAHGARHVFFLPLATDPDVFSPPPRSGIITEATSTLVFVGRSEFPGKDRFFVGQSVPENILAEARSHTQDGKRTDFSWWLEKLGNAPEDTPLWPGSASRRASLGAEESSLAWRTACLRAATPLGLTIYGDPGWQDRFPSGNAKTAPILRPPLDYYAQLAAVYATAPFSLNMMSYLLPEGLNQRHFDVWAAGGFCLMDDCRGLNLFPPELTEPVTFGKPEDIPTLTARHAGNTAEKARLTQAWRELILTEHTYAHRMRVLAESVFS